MLINIGAELTAQLAESRRDAESLMLDACTIARLGEAVTDPDTGEMTNPATELYEGRAKVQTYEAQETDTDAGAGVQTLQRYMLHIPVGSYRPTIGDVATITAAATDPEMLGRRYRVVALLHKTLATAYRLGVIEEV